MNRPDHISEAEWNSMSPRAKKRATRVEREPSPAEKELNLALSIGGRRWQKNGKDRVYFNDVRIGDPVGGDGAYITGYYDVAANEWVCASGHVTLSGAEFRAAVMSR